MTDQASLETVAIIFANQIDIELDENKLPYYLKPLSNGKNQALMYLKRLLNLTCFKKVILVIHPNFKEVFQTTLSELNSDNLEVYYQEAYAKPFFYSRLNWNYFSAYSDDDKDLGFIYKYMCDNKAVKAFTDSIYNGFLDPKQLIKYVKQATDLNKAYLLTKPLWQNFENMQNEPYSFGFSGVIYGFNFLKNIVFKDSTLDRPYAKNKATRQDLTWVEAQNNNNLPELDLRTCTKHGYLRLNLFLAKESFDYYDSNLKNEGQNLACYLDSYRELNIDIAKTNKTEIVNFIKERSQYGRLSFIVENLETVSEEEFLAWLDFFKQYQEIFKILYITDQFKLEYCKNLAETFNGIFIKTTGYPDNLELKACGDRVEKLNKLTYVLDDFWLGVELQLTGKDDLDFANYTKWKKILMGSIFSSDKVYEREVNHVIQCLKVKRA